MTLNGIIIQMCFKCTILGMYFFDFRERERKRDRERERKEGREWRREKDLRSGLKLSLGKWVFDWIIIHES